MSSLQKPVSADPVDVATSFLHVREIRPNRSPEIDSFNKPFKNIGGPYCATGVAYCLKHSGAVAPKGTSLARNYYTRGYETYSAKDVLTKKVQPQRNHIVVWGKGSTFYGHTGFVILYNITTGIITTIEFNTSGNSTGSQSNGDGVYIKKRKIQPYSYFKIIGFSRVKFAEAVNQNIWEWRYNVQ